MHTRAQKHQRLQPGRSGDNARPGNTAVRGRQVHPTLQLQRTIGNQAAQRLLKSRGESFATGFGANATSAGQIFQETNVRAETPASIQPKLTVNTPGDIYEREADSVADQVMRMPGLVQRNCTCSGGCSGYQGQTEHAALKKNQLQAQPVRENDEADNRSWGAPPIVNEVLRSPGQPLDAETRDFMEPRFGQDFSRVRIHTDNKAVESAQAVNAQAYTVGSHIALGHGKYAPRTLEGRRLLAHELTHVVHQTGGSERAPGLQRQGEPGAKPAKSYPFSVAYSGCDEPPHNKEIIESAVRTAFEQARDTDCIKNQSLKDDILSKYDGLKIVCKQDDLPGKCAEATSPFSQTMNLFASAYKGDCASLLEVVIFHESVHFTQWSPFSHGSLAWDCQEACFEGRDEHKRGNASNCLHETTFLPFAGISMGNVFAGKGASASYVRLYAGMEKRGPILSFVHPSFGIGISFIGKPTSAGANIPSGHSTLFSLMGALRFDPARLGGGYVSLSGGLELGERNDKLRPGYEVGAAFGYRWYVFDVSLDAGIEYDPTQETGAEKMYTLGASLKIGPKIRR